MEIVGTQISTNGAGVIRYKQTILSALYVDYIVSVMIFEVT